MAKIFKTNSQEQALKDIVDDLKIISSLNKLLKDENVSDSKIKIMGSTVEGILNEQIPIPYNLLTSTLKDYRKRLIKEVLDKAKTFSIQLDDNENQILGLMPESEPEKKTETETESTSYQSYY